MITLCERVLDVWTSSQHSVNPLLARHRCESSPNVLPPPTYSLTNLTSSNSDITALLLLSLSTLPKSSQYPLSLATSPKFLNAMSRYLGNTEPAVRLLGMLVAEEVAKMSGRSLELGEWDGEKDGRGWIRKLRKLMQGSDRDAVIVFDDEHHAEPEQTKAPPSPVHPTKEGPLPSCCPIKTRHHIISRTRFGRRLAHRLRLIPNLIACTISNTIRTR